MNLRLLLTLLLFVMMTSQPGAVFAEIQILDEITVRAQRIAPLRVTLTIREVRER